MQELGHSIVLSLMELDPYGLMMWAAEELNKHLLLALTDLMASITVAIVKMLESLVALQVCC